jgi:hypothetical protein
LVFGPGARSITDVAALTVALRDPASPVRLFLEHRYPASREIQRKYLGSAGPLLVPGALEVRAVDRDVAGRDHAFTT